MNASTKAAKEGSREQEPLTPSLLDSTNQSARPATSARVRVFEQLAASDWVRGLAQLGYAAKGLLYIVVGGTAAMGVLSLGRRVRGSSGALNLLIASPFGRVGVAFVVAGLCGFILRRVVQIFVSPTIGKPPKRITRILRRIGYALSGLGHLGIALTSLELLLGLSAFSRAGGTSINAWMSLLLIEPSLRTSLIRIAGLVIIGFAIFQLYLAVSRRFTVDLRIEEMSDDVKKMTYGCGVAGYAGRGVAFLVSGAFLVYAGWFVPDIEVGGMSSVLKTFQTWPFGTWIFFAVAAGLTAYGLYLLFAAWYLRVVQ